LPSNGINGETVASSVIAVRRPGEPNGDDDCNFFVKLIIGSEFQAGAVVVRASGSGALTNQGKHRVAFSIDMIEDAVAANRTIIYSAEISPFAVVITKAGRVG
jgi:hypothetical protein